MTSWVDNQSSFVPLCPNWTLIQEREEHGKSSSKRKRKSKSKSTKRKSIKSINVSSGYSQDPLNLPLYILPSDYCHLIHGSPMTPDRDYYVSFEDGFDWYE